MGRLVDAKEERYQRAARKTRIKVKGQRKRPLVTRDQEQPRQKQNDQNKVEIRRLSTPNSCSVKRSKVKAESVDQPKKIREWLSK